MGTAAEVGGAERKEWGAGKNLHFKIEIYIPDVDFHNKYC